ncbi:MAG: hypothetical protein H6625_10155 [Bdellovibrionaceae bacterium]|nr:hypothetical protein [Pseudobdellovibrionaceae bacterium]
MKNLDDLYHLFEAHLLQLDIEKESHSDFISTVVETYLEDLKTKGHVCLQFELDLRDDVEFEVVSMLRKKIYGHFNVDIYRKTLREKKIYQ